MRELENEGMRARSDGEARDGEIMDAFARTEWTGGSVELFGTKDEVRSHNRAVD